MLFPSLGRAAPEAVRAMIPQAEPISLVAARMEGPNAVVQRTRGRVYLPKADEEVGRDAAGRLAVDSRWEYMWNVRGELLRAESKHRSPNIRLDYAYYPSGPLARREKREWRNGQWALVSTTRWVVDGWRPVKEVEEREGGVTVERMYTWGLDLAGWRDRRSLDESGGIGGLLAVRERVNGGEWATYYVLGDPQGNVVALATADGTLVARFDYDPYGRLIRETGPKGATCPFRYSTKWYDADLGLLYYGHRWYDAAAMKWLSPDPIGERGGANLTAFCDGDPVNRVDPLGLETEIAAILRLRYGFEFLPSRKNMRPQVRLEAGIGIRGDLGDHVTPKVEAIASMLIGGPRTSATETRVTWDLNVLAGVAVHRGRSDSELPKRITGLTPIFANPYEESATPTLAINYITGLRLRTVVADRGVRSGDTMVGLYNDVFLGPIRGRRAAAITGGAGR